jgi:diacylglycerol kinase
MQKHHISFIHAKDGLITAFQSQPNFRVHLILSFLAIALGIVLKISSDEWVILSMTITLGLVIELVNTAIEFTVDLITKEYNIYAKYAKDTSAAAMLTYAVGAVIIGSWIFLPKILVLWKFI